METTSDVHTIWDRSKFTSYKPFTKKNQETLTGIDGVSIEVLGTGTAMLPTIVDGEVTGVELTNVYHVPAMDYNLLSIGALEAMGCYCTIQDGRFDVMDGEDARVVFAGTRVDNIYILDLKYATTPNALRSSTMPRHQ